MKMQKSVIFVNIWKKKYWEYLKDSKYCKVRNLYHYTGEYRGPALSICNLKYSAPKKFSVAFHNGSN